jgi:hypothetical protein
VLPLTLLVLVLVVPLFDVAVLVVLVVLPLHAGKACGRPSPANVCDQYAFPPLLYDTPHPICVYVGPRIFAK